MEEAGEEVGFGGDVERVCRGEVVLDRSAWTPHGLGLEANGGEKRGFQVVWIGVP